MTETDDDLDRGECDDDDEREVLGAFDPETRTIRIGTPEDEGDREDDDGDR